MSPTKSPDKKTSIENKENIGSQQTQLRNQSTPKTKKPVGSKTQSQTPNNKTPSGKTAGTKTPVEASTSEKAANGRAPGGKIVVSKQKGSKTPSGPAPDRGTGKGKTPAPKTPTLKAPKTPSGKMEGVTKQDARGDQEAKTPGRGAGSLKNQTPKSSKKEKGKNQLTPKTPVSPHCMKLVQMKLKFSQTLSSLLWRTLAQHFALTVTKQEMNWPYLICMR